MNGNSNANSENTYEGLNANKNSNLGNAPAFDEAKSDAAHLYDELKSSPYYASRALELLGKIKGYLFSNGVMNNEMLDDEFMEKIDSLKAKYAALEEQDLDDAEYGFIEFIKRKTEEMSGSRSKRRKIGGRRRRATKRRSSRRCGSRRRTH